MQFRLPAAILMAAAFFQMTACRATTPQSEVDVAFGTEIPDTEEPAVVRLARTTGTLACSGTFIAPNAVLTAAHCRPYELTALGKAPKEVIYPGLDFAKVHPRDMAIMIFAEDIAPAVADLATARPPVGDEAKLVGYGCDQHGVFDKRRAGKSAIKEFPVEGIFKDMLLIGRPAGFVGEPGDNAKMCPGDSGGPLLHKGRVVGVTSGGGGAYADLQYSSNQSLLRAANARGAKITGVSAEADASLVVIDGPLWEKQIAALRPTFLAAVELVRDFKKTLVLTPGDDGVYVDPLPMHVDAGSIPYKQRPHGRELARWLTLRFEAVDPAEKIHIGGAGLGSWRDELAGAGINVDSGDWDAVKVRSQLKNYTSNSLRGFLLLSAKGAPGNETYGAEFFRCSYEHWPSNGGNP